MAKTRITIALAAASVGLGLMLARARSNTGTASRELGVQSRRKRGKASPGAHSRHLTPKDDLALDGVLLAKLGQAGADHGWARIRLARAEGTLERADAADALAAATAVLDQAKAALADPANRGKPAPLPGFLASRPRSK